MREKRAQSQGIISRGFVEKDQSLYYFLIEYLMFLDGRIIGLFL
jgi:hypothetical protein